MNVNFCLHYLAFLCSIFIKNLPLLQRANKSKVRVYECPSFTCISEKFKNRTQKLFPKPKGENMIIPSELLNLYTASKV